MKVAYVDSSIIVRYYLPDESGQIEAAAIIDDPDTAIVTAALTRIEVSGALVRAARGRRVASIQGALDRLDVDFDQGLVTMVSAAEHDVHRVALDMVRRHGIRALDAIHVATAVLVFPAITEEGDQPVFVCRDRAQSAAAVELGLTLG